jgi:hypothetical protein
MTPTSMDGDTIGKQRMFAGRWLGGIKKGKILNDTFS